MLRTFVSFALFVLAFVRPLDILSAELEAGPLLQKIREVGPKGKGHKQAIEAMQKRQPEPSLGYTPVARSQVVPLDEGVVQPYGAGTGPAGFIVE